MSKIPTPLKAFAILTVFTCGFTVCGNLFHLVPTNPNYDASWVKVVVCLAIASTIGVSLCKEK
jgi:hypothetical protein